MPIADAAHPTLADDHERRSNVGSHVQSVKDGVQFIVELYPIGTFQELRFAVMWITNLAPTGVVAAILLRNAQPDLLDVDVVVLDGGLHIESSLLPVEPSLDRPE